MFRRKRASESAGRPQWLYAVAGAALIMLAAWVVYFPCLRGEFILDDDIYLTNNTFIRASDGLHKFWFTTEPIDYYPVSNSSFWIEWRLWGMNPTGYHVTNLLLHIASAMLIWIILRKLAIPGPWLAALLFAVHPVNVESVAWIAQRKDVLAVFFFLLSILWYLKNGYWLSLLFFTLAMLSKGSVAILPLVLLLLLWWQKGRLTMSDWLRSILFFVVAAALSAVHVWAQSQGGQIIIRSAGPAHRIVGAGAVVWFYLSKALFPIKLAFVYPQWDIHPKDWRWWLPLAATLAVTVALIVRRNSRVGRPLLLAWGFFCIALLPVMGLVDVGFMKYSPVADHYQHIAIIAVIAILASLAQRLPLSAVRVLTLLTAGVLACFSWRQAKHYTDPVTLYEDTLQKNPGSWLIHNNLGSTFKAMGQNEKALAQFEDAVRLNPGFAEAHYNIGVTLLEAGQPSEAINHLEQAPDLEVTHYTLANALLEVGRRQEAIQHLRRALEMAPDFPEAHNNLANALSASGQVPEAIERYREAVRLDPSYIGALNNLGVALKSTGRLGDAIQCYRQAIRINPKFAEAHANLGNALRESGNLVEAIEHYEQAVRLKPDYQEAYSKLVDAYAQTNQPAQAIATAEKALAAARAAGQIPLAERIGNWLTTYRASLHATTQTTK